MSATSEHYVLSENEAEPIWFLVLKPHFLE